MAALSNAKPTLGGARPPFGISLTKAALPCFRLAATTQPRVCASKGLVCGLAILVEVLCAGHAWADPISFQFTANIQNAGGDRLTEIFGTAPRRGSTLRAVFTTDTPNIPADPNPNPNIREYQFNGSWTISTGSSTVKFRPNLFEGAAENDEITCCENELKDHVFFDSVSIFNGVAQFDIS